ncbi:response regulator [Paracidovorax citrulli]
MWRVLCVDDDAEKARDVGDYLKEWEGNALGEFHVEIASTFENAIERIKREQFDLVTLDLHGATDPLPEVDDGGEDQEGRRILDVIRKSCFLPVVFYTGFAEKIASLESPVVKVVKKGEDDVSSVRSAVEEIFATGLPKLSALIQRDKREFMWDIVDGDWNVGKQKGADLAYLLARRLAARFSGVSVKEALGHPVGSAKPIELYIYPPVDSSIFTGSIVKQLDGFWLVVTPACDFAQRKASNVLMVQAYALEDHDIYKAWVADPSKKNADAVKALIDNKKGDRFRFLPGTFYLPDLVVDFQALKTVVSYQFPKEAVVCRIDSPFREELLNLFSKYYGRVGIPQVDVSLSMARIV